MASRFKYGFCLLLVGLLTSNKLFSQEEEKRFAKKNLIEVNIPFYHFLDGSKPLFQYAYFGINKKVYADAIGTSYTRLISDKGVSVRTAIDFFLIYNSPVNPQQRIPPGSISKRRASLFSLGVSFPLVSSAFGDFLIIVDAIHRRGAETMILNYNGWETRSKSYEMKDWGLSSGVQFSKDLTKRFVFSAEASATYFVYRNDVGGTYDYDKGSTKAMLTLRFGLGYRF